MSASRTTRLLVRLYPPSWQARYGDELEDVIVQQHGGRRLSWRAGADVAVGAARERLRASGLTGDALPPRERARAGSLLVLWAWVLFVLAGGSMQKLSEHWRAATPHASHTLPTVAFDGLLAAALAGSALVLATIATALPSLLAFLRAGGWPQIRRPIVTAALCTLVAVAATVVLVRWAHGLDQRQRDGHDLPYAAGFVAWALTVVACLVAWTVAATATARRLELPARALRLDAWLAVGVTTCMLVMTAMAITWWAALAGATPATLPQLVATTGLMAVASALGAAGSTRAVRAVSTAPR